MFQQGIFDGRFGCVGHFRFRRGGLGRCFFDGWSGFGQDLGRFFSHRFARFSSAFFSSASLFSSAKRASSRRCCSAISAAKRSSSNRFSSAALRSASSSRSRRAFSRFASAACFSGPFSRQPLAVFLPLPGSQGGGFFPHAFFFGAPGFLKLLFLLGFLRRHSFLFSLFGGALFPG
jgi:hypothetical protein